MAATGTIVAGLNAFGARLSTVVGSAGSRCNSERQHTRFRDGKPVARRIAAAVRDAKRKKNDGHGSRLPHCERPHHLGRGHGTVGFSTDQNYADLVVSRA